MAKDRAESVITVLSSAWIAWFVLPFALLLGALVWRFDAASAVLHDVRFWAAFGISLASAVIVIALSAVFCVPAAYWFAYREFRWKHVLEALLIDIPQTFPPVAVGTIYLIAFGPGSSVNIAFTFAAVIIAKLVVSAPFTLSYALRRFREIQQSKLDHVARSLGAGSRDVLFRVLVPMARKDIRAGLTLSAARAMGEFGGSLIFAGVIAYKTEVLPTYTNRVVTGDPYLALAATAVMVVFAVVAIVIVRSILERRKQ